MSNNTFSTTEKKIHLALGALIDGSYLWAGAEKSIANEMQGKDNGDRIYYKRTKLADGSVQAVTKGTEKVGGGDVGWSDIKQVDTKVTIWDARVGYYVNAIDKEITNYGEALAMVKIGQKLGKKAVEKAWENDKGRIGNIWFGNNWEAFQTASAYMKSFIDEKLYGWTHWEAWGKLTAQGQNSVPCGLADKRFGHELIGKWNLIDELRSCRFLDKITTQALGTGVTGSAGSASDGVVEITFTNGTAAAGTAIGAGKTVFFTMAGVYNTDTNGEKAMPYVFSYTADSSGVAAGGTFKISLEEADYNLLILPSSMSGVTCTTLAGVAADKTYAPMLFRAEKAQCFGSMNKCSCEGPKYEKQSTDGFTIHVNTDCDIAGLRELKRFDLVFASKLVEPRAAALVYIQLD